jgi:integral membrane protein
MGSALLRYRVMAYIVGVLLIVLFFVAMPLKYLADSPTMVAVVGPVHGFLYMVYLVVAFHLAMRLRWPLTRTALLLLAGTVPVMSFVAERWVTARVRQAHTTPAPGSAHSVG